MHPFVRPNLSLSVTVGGLLLHKPGAASVEKAVRKMLSCDQTSCAEWNSNPHLPTPSALWAAMLRVTPLALFDRQIIDSALQIQLTSINWSFWNSR